MPYYAEVSMMTSTGLKLIIMGIALQSGCHSYQYAKPARQAQQTESVSNAVDVNQGELQESGGPAIKLYPIDEGPNDASFDEFRNRLLRAAREHDAAFILSILDPRIINSSDGEGGVREFKDQWKLDQPEGRLWETLTTILSMGGSFRMNSGRREFCAPYVTSQWPSVVNQLPKGADPLDYQVITGKNVAFRSEPNLTAPVLKSLSYDIVKVQSASSAWLKITTLSGEQGYVLNKYIRSPTDYQACFRKISERWVMTELAARE